MRLPGSGGSAACSIPELLCGKLNTLLFFVRGATGRLGEMRSSSTERDLRRDRQPVAERLNNMSMRVSLNK